MSRLFRQATGSLLAALTLVSSACATVQPYDSVQHAIATGSAVIYVTKADSTMMKLTSPVIKGDTLFGYSQERLGRYYRPTALSDITSVRAETLNSDVLLTMAIVGGLAVALMVSIAHSCNWNCGTTSR